MTRIICNGKSQILYRVPEASAAIFDTEGWEIYESSGPFGNIYLSELGGYPSPAQLFQFSVCEKAEIRVLPDSDDPVLYLNLYAPLAVTFDNLNRLQMEEAYLALHCGQYPFF